MKANTSPYAARLALLREELARQGVEGFLVPRADEYQGERVPESAQRLAWISGFTGSAGCAVILPGRAAVFSDGRYAVQLKQQIDTALFAPVNNQDVPLADWLAEQADGLTVGYDPRLHTAAEIDRIAGKEVRLVPLAANPLDAVWRDRPAPPAGKVSIFPDRIAGASARDKAERIAEEIEKSGALAAVITLPDSVAWLLNIRGSDVAQTPVPLCFAVIGADGLVQLYIEPSKVGADVRAHLGNKVEPRAPQDLAGGIAALGVEAAAQGKPVWLDLRHAPVWFRQALEAQGAAILNRRDPCIAPKARKTPSEQAAMKAAHVRDGAALVKFLCWLDREAPKGTLTELNVEAKLREFRAQAPEYRENSFETIAGFGPNGAIVHYRATTQSDLKLSPPGLLLVDSGAQYEDGTTDVTRTVAVGGPSAEQVTRYTQVLKGHVAVARAKFPAGTTGAQIDALARAPLWAEGLDYAHGTGHGVGCYLSVHEEAAPISPRGQDAVEAGMIVSNEPGYYKEDHYGIRIENLVLAVEAGRNADTGKPMLAFETLTLCPYDARLIDAALLSTEEKAWVNAYHARTREILSPLVDNATRAWLEEATRTLS